LVKYNALLLRILAGRSDANISFSDIRQLLTVLGFHERIKGDHHIFTKPGVEDIVNLQPTGSKAKTYQVRQVRNLVLKYKLEVKDVE